MHFLVHKIILTSRLITRKKYCMSLPFHRGQISSTNMTYRGSSWGGKDKVDEANRSLMEQENDRKWVSLHDT